MLEQLLAFTRCSSIEFFNSPYSLKQLVWLPGVTYHLLCNICVTYRTSCYSISHQVFPVLKTAQGSTEFSALSPHILGLPATKSYYLVGSMVLFMCKSLLQNVISTSCWFRIHFIITSSICCQTLVLSTRPYSLFIIYAL